jgi:hypothetical protein
MVGGRLEGFHFCLGTYDSLSFFNLRIFMFSSALPTAHYSFSERFGDMKMW